MINRIPTLQASIFFRLWGSPTALQDIHFIITNFVWSVSKNVRDWLYGGGGVAADVIVSPPPLSQRRQLTQMTKAGVTPRCVMSPCCRPNNCHKLWSLNHCHCCFWGGTEGVWGALVKSMGTQQGRLDVPSQIQFDGWGLGKNEVLLRVF